MSTEQHDESDTLVGIGEGARLLGVAEGTLRRWSDGGLITTLRTPGGQRRFLVSDLRKLIRKPPPRQRERPRVTAS